MTHTGPAATPLPTDYGTGSGVAPSPTGESLLRRSPGRRSSDGVKQGAAWALIVGALFQGGFMLMSWRLMAMGERQLERERTMLVAQHAELVATMRELTQAVRERCP